MLLKLIKWSICIIPLLLFVNFEFSFQRFYSHWESTWLIDVGCLVCHIKALVILADSCTSLEWQTACCCKLYISWISVHKVRAGPWSYLKSILLMPLLTAELNFVMVLIGYVFAQHTSMTLITYWEAGMCKRASGTSFQLLFQIWWSASSLDITSHVA